MCRLARMLRTHHTVPLVTDLLEGKDPKQLPKEKGPWVKSGETGGKLPRIHAGVTG